MAFAAALALGRCHGVDAPPLCAEALTSSPSAAYAVCPASVSRSSHLLGCVREGCVRRSYHILGFGCARHLCAEAITSSASGVRGICAPKLSPPRLRVCAVSVCRSYHLLGFGCPRHPCAEALTSSPSAAYTEPCLVYQDHPAIKRSTSTVRHQNTSRMKKKAKENKTCR